MPRDLPIGDLRDDRLVHGLATTYRDGAVPLELAQLTGLSVHSVRDRLVQLAAAGRVVSVGTVPAGQGRPYQLWALPHAIAEEGAAARCLAIARGRLTGVRVRLPASPARRARVPVPVPAPVHVARRRPAAVVQDPASARLLRVLRSAAAPVPTAELEQLTGSTRSALRARLETLAATGEVHQVTRTRVILTPRARIRLTVQCWTVDPTPIRIPPAA